MISLSAILLVLGVIAGLARGGKLGNIAAAEFRWTWLVFTGLVIQISAELVAAFVDPGLREGGKGIAILGTSYLFLIAFVALNRGLPGIWLIGAGLLLNLAVIIPNGGMPVSLDAARAAGIDPSDYLDNAIKHRPMGPETILWFLGDIFPLPVLEKVVSAGDVILAVGIFRMIERLMRYTPKRLKASPSSARPSTEP